MDSSSSQARSSQARFRPCVAMHDNAKEFEQEKKFIEASHLEEEAISCRRNNGLAYYSRPFFQAWALLKADPALAWRQFDTEQLLLDQAGLAEFNRAIPLTDAEGNTVRSWLATERVNSRQFGEQNVDIALAQTANEREKTLRLGVDAFHRVGDLSSRPQGFVALGEDMLAGYNLDHFEGSDLDGEVTRLFAEGGVPTIHIAQILELPLPDTETLEDASADYEALADLERAQGNFVTAVRYVALARDLTADGTREDELLLKERELWFEDGVQRWDCSQVDNTEARRSFQLGGWYVDSGQMKVRCDNTDGHNFALGFLEANTGNCEKATDYFVAALNQAERSSVKWSWKLYDLHIWNNGLGMAHTDWLREALSGEREFSFPEKVDFEWEYQSFPDDFWSSFQASINQTSIDASMVRCLARQEGGNR